MLNVYWLPSYFVHLTGFSLVKSLKWIINGVILIIHWLRGPTVEQEVVMTHSEVEICKCFGFVRCCAASSGSSYLYYSSTN